jgi:hypothetical protein
VKRCIGCNRPVFVKNRDYITRRPSIMGRPQDIEWPACILCIDSILQATDAELRKAWGMAPA